MRGYVAHKGNRWYAVVYQGIDPATGRERRRWYPAGDERAQAEALARQLAADEVERRGNGYSRPTFGGHMARHWLPRKRRERLQAGTLERYDALLRTHVLPDIGSTPLRSLTSDAIDALYTRLLREGRVDGTGGLAIKTVHEIHLIVRAVLDDAVYRELLVVNPARLATAPRFRPNRRARRMAWTATELASFLNRFGDHLHHRTFQLAAYTGMRRCELLGLRWRDIDFHRQRLTIVRAIVYANGQAVETPCKTATSARTIDLDDTTVAVLDRWRTDHDKRFGADPNRGLLTKPDGRLLHPHTLSQAFSRAVGKTDLTPISFHGLRHTHATLLIKAGVPVKVVSERLGHSHPAFTMATYQHVLPGMQADAAATFAALLHSPTDQHHWQDTPGLLPGHAR